MMGRSELCAWLRANSSGDYRPAAEAADEIEHLAESAASHFKQAMLNGEAANEFRQDAERYRWLAARMFAADFDYGGEGVQALVFEMPAGFSASADCGATIDAAILASAELVLPNGKVQR
jgi:hypothetical protein